MFLRCFVALGRKFVVTAAGGAATGATPTGATRIGRRPMGGAITGTRPTGAITATTGGTRPTGARAMGIRAIGGTRPIGGTPIGGITPGGITPGGPIPIRAGIGFFMRCTNTRIPIRRMVGGIGTACNGSTGRVSVCLGPRRDGTCFITSNGTRRVSMFFY